MSRIVPGPPLQPRNADKKEQPKFSKDPCQRPECVERRDRIEGLRLVNEELEGNLEDLDYQVKVGINQQESLLKSNEAQILVNEELESQISEITQREGLLEIEAEEGARNTRDLQRKVDALKSEISKFTTEAASKNREREAALRSNQSEVVFRRVGSRRTGGTVNERLDKTMARSLDLWEGEFGGSVMKQGEYIRAQTANGRMRRGMVDHRQQVPISDDSFAETSSFTFDSTWPPSSQFNVPPVERVQFKMPIPSYMAKAKETIRPKSMEVKGKGRLSSQRGRTLGAAR
jgi:chaperonin cofactor prefoldin